MSRGESNHRMRTATENLSMLRRLACTQFIKEEETFVLRDMAFVHGGRDLPYHKMVEHLILAYTPLAITERLTQ